MAQPQDPPPARTDRSPWDWLLLLPIVLPQAEPVVTAGGLA